MNVKVRMLRAMPAVGGVVQVGIMKVKKEDLDAALILASDSDIATIDYGSTGREGMALGETSTPLLKISFAGNERAVPGVLSNKKV
jgi:hypothetical protein